MKGRAFKQRVLEHLMAVDLNAALDALCRMPPRKTVNPLFSFLYSGDDQIRWRAVKAMGAVAANLADQDMESGRVIIRRLMWNLNDESGGIGWGSPEAMGEILACHGGLAQEYAPILLSYTLKDGNYLEHEMLQRGLLWGIGRLSQVRPALARGAAPSLLPYLKSPDACVRGLAAWTMGLLKIREALEELHGLTRDRSLLEIYRDDTLVACPVKDLAEEALQRLSLLDPEPPVPS